MNEEAHQDMQMDQKSLGTVRPVGIMLPFEQKHEHAAGDGQVMPERQAIVGGLQNYAAKHDAGHGDMGRSGTDAQPSHAL